MIKARITAGAQPGHGKLKLILIADGQALASFPPVGHTGESPQLYVDNTPSHFSGIKITPGRESATGQLQRTFSGTGLDFLLDT
jgi:hypothetical protein